MNNSRALFLVAFILCCFLAGSSAFPEKGKWVFDVNQNVELLGVTKSMFADSKIFVKSK